MLPVEGLGEAVGKLKQVYELLGVEAALAGAPVHEVAEVQAAHVAEHAVPRRADAEDLAALRHLLKRGVDVVIIPAGLGADDGGRAGEGAHGEGAGYLIELAVLADGVEEGLHDARTAAELLIRLYVGPQVLEKALVPEDVHRQGARHQNIRHGAGAYLRYELREAGGVVVVGVELGIVAHLDAVIAALAVEVEYLALDAVVEVYAGEGEGGLLRHLVIGGLLEGDEIGDCAVAAGGVLAAQADDVAVFGQAGGAYVVAVNVAVYPGDELLLGVGGEGVAVEALALVVAEVIAAAGDPGAVGLAGQLGYGLVKAERGDVHGAQAEGGVLGVVGQGADAAVSRGDDVRDAGGLVREVDLAQLAAVGADDHYGAVHHHVDVAVPVHGEVGDVEILVLLRKHGGQVDLLALSAGGVEGAQVVGLDVGVLHVAAGHGLDNGYVHGGQGVGRCGGLALAGALRAVPFRRSVAAGGDGIADVLYKGEAAAGQRAHAGDPAAAVLGVLGRLYGAVALKGLEVCAVQRNAVYGGDPAVIGVLLHDGLAVLVEDGVAVVVIGRYLLHDGVAFHVGEEVYAPVGEHGVAHAAEVAAELRVVGDIGVFRGRGIGRTASAAGREQAQRHYKRQDDAESLFQLHHVVLQ